MSKVRSNIAVTFNIINGAQGEGGGQVLRTALTLAILTRQDIELINIRAGRKNRGYYANILLRYWLPRQYAGQKPRALNWARIALGFHRGK